MAAVSRRPLRGLLADVAVRLRGGTAVVWETRYRQSMAISAALVVKQISCIHREVVGASSPAREAILCCRKSAQGLQLQSQGTVHI